MSPPAASLALHPVPAPCDRDRSAASILLSMSNEEPPHQDIDISDEQHNSSDGANASRKGQPWTEEEHMAFLQGLRKLGKGNWRQISRSFVPSRTPTQVASHAQKHFMRVAGATKRKSRFTALEVEVVTGPAVQSSLSEQAAQGSHPCQEQPVSLVLQPTAIPSLAPAFPAVPFPFMPPMMFGFPGPFFPPFVCPPPAPAFAAAALSAIQKQGHMPMMMPPVFPLAAMAAMNPFFMAHQMAAAAQAAAANAANVNAGREAASGGATTAGTAATATTDTATSADVGRQPRSAPGSPPVCKQEAQSVRPSEQVASGTASPLPGRPAPGTGTAVDGATGLTYRERKDAVPVAEATGIKQEEGLLSFQTSSYSTFRPRPAQFDAKSDS